MKTAIYIEYGRTQLILTPETEYEKKMVSGFYDKRLSVEIKKGEFYRCQGGYTRMESYPGDDSLMLVIDEVDDS